MKNRAIGLLITGLLIACALPGVGPAVIHAQSKGQSAAAADEGRDPAPRSLELNEKGIAAVGRREWHVAEDSFRQAILADPGNLTAVFNLAGVYLTQKKHEPAITLLSDYVKKYERDAGLFVRLGDAYFSSKQINAALDAYGRAFKLAPDYDGLPSKMATLYGLKKDFPKTEEMLERAVKQRPDDPQLLNNLSNVYILNGKSDSAVSTAKRALQIKASKELYVTLATAYEAKRDFKNSLIAFEKAIDLGDARPETKNKVEALRKVVGDHA